MTALGTRIARLEGRSRPTLSNVAVVSDYLPEVVTDEWAIALVTRHGWDGQVLAVWVRQGEPTVLLEPTPEAWIKGDAETIWLACGDTYPHAMIMSGPGFVLTNRYDSEAERRQWLRDAERELAS